jgi:hypothetical protein
MMTGLRQVTRKIVSLVSILALFLPSVALAKPLDANTVHAKIAKRGVGAWVCVEERSGLLLTGRVVSIDDGSFGIQLRDYPEVTSIFYSDVTKLRFSLSGKALGLIVGLSVGATLAFALIAHHEFESNKPSFPTQPTQPVFP